jgi:hypothetical protein
MVLFYPSCTVNPVQYKRCILDKGTHRIIKTAVEPEISYLHRYYSDSLHVKAKKKLNARTPDHTGEIKNINVLNMKQLC